MVAKIISLNQYGFVHGRKIQECIGIAFEAINMLSKKVRGGNVAYKVDIHKAFDTLSWKFLLLILTRFGFHPSFFGWISTILYSAMFSIRMMAVWWVFFPSSRGVRQGDHLSPLLFCLAKKVLSRGISKLVNDRKILHMASPQGYLIPSHILYVDGIFVFCRGDIKSLKNLSLFLKTYGVFSGQYVNNSNSSFFTMDNFARFVTKIQRIRSCSHGCLPFNYLGVPIFVGVPTCRFLQPLADKVKLKLASWKGKSLSMMGRIQLVNTVINGFLAYSFNMYK